MEIENLAQFLKKIDTDDVAVDASLSFLGLSDAEPEYDVRSAGFATFGRAKATGGRAVLVMDGAYLPNVYTVFTEAWFQKTDLVVVALHQNFYDVETHYLDRCTVVNMTLKLDDVDQFKNHLEQSLEVVGPKLYNVVVPKLVYPAGDYKEVAEVLAEMVSPNDRVTIYNSNARLKMPCILNMIDRRYQYGLLSKYVATISLGESQHYLVTSMESMLIDLNILNSRYLDKKFKVILVCDTNSNKYVMRLKNWVLANGIDFKVAKNLHDDITNLTKVIAPSILVIKQEGK